MAAQILPRLHYAVSGGGAAHALGVNVEGKQLVDSAQHRMVVLRTVFYALTDESCAVKVASVFCMLASPAEVHASLMPASGCRPTMQGSLMLSGIYVGRSRAVTKSAQPFTGLHEMGRWLAA